MPIGVWAAVWLRDRASVFIVTNSSSAASSSLQSQSRSLLRKTMTLQNPSLENKAKLGNAIDFIESSVTDWQTLAAGVAAGTEVFILDGTRDGVVQISEIMQTRQNVAAIHIISHGSPGNVKLGNITLNSGNIETYTNLLQQWGNALSDVLLH
ncbi:MAG TPA: hypothetical protein DCE56_10870 [Cyanobacteria bacterium UBA8553]|nr:hypothetical protein [Cyanobacteria bacterium UBA8553]